MNVHITEIDMLIRLGLGFLAGVIIGLERSSRHQISTKVVPTPMCANFTIFNHGGHGVSQRKDDFRIKNSVFLRVLCGFIL